MDRIEKPFDQRSQKYRNRYLDALNDLYRTVETENNAIGNAKVERSPSLYLCATGKLIK